MADQERAEIIKRIKKTQENIGVVIALIVIFILLFYFFTYPRLVTEGMIGLSWVEAVTWVMWVVVLFRIGPISFFFTRLWLGRRPAYRELMSTLTRADLSNS